MNIATVFSGIGAPEYALKTYFPDVKQKIVFACDCGEVKDYLAKEQVEKLYSIKDQKERAIKTKEFYLKLRKRHWVKETYFKNYSIDEERWFDDIRFIDGKPFKGKVDLFIGGSPCQSFSNMGKRRGLEDARGTLFYDFARLVKEISPKVFIYENVPGMLTHDKGNTWQTIKGIFDSLGYYFEAQVLNASKYGIPQNRKRLFVVGFKKKEWRDKFTFPNTIPLSINAKSFYEDNVDSKYYLKEKGFKFVTTHPGRAKINEEIIRTEKRNQEFNWNGDFVFEPLDGLKNKKNVLKSAYVGVYEGVKGVVRKLTPRECHSLMGFKNDFKICENDVEAYKQAGNSIVVDVLKEIYKSIFLTGALS